MSGFKDSIDLMNVDYDDVLHLYRGWRKSEASLKEKVKELNSLKEKVKDLQDSHAKFRGKMQALESVKEVQNVATSVLRKCFSCIYSSLIKSPF